MEEKPHYLGHRQRVREKFLKNGLESFQEYEAIELLLMIAIPRKDVKIPAKEALKKFGSFRDVLDAPVEELRRIKGIGETAPVVIKFIREAANRYLKQRSKQEFSLEKPDTLFDFCKSSIGPEPNEIFKVIYLDGRFRIIDEATLAEGTIDQAVIYPRKVMESAIQKKASILMFVHNHPDGDVTPSDFDKIITRSLVLAAKTLQIEVYDHIIVSKDEVFSFRENGLL